jgi:hypothetical protein
VDGTSSELHLMIGFEISGAETISLTTRWLVYSYFGIHSVIQNQH